MCHMYFQNVTRTILVLTVKKCVMAPAKAVTVLQVCVKLDVKQDGEEAIVTKVILFSFKKHIAKLEWIFLLLEYILIIIYKTKCLSKNNENSRSS